MFLNSNIISTLRWCLVVNKRSLYETNMSNYCHSSEDLVETVKFWYRAHYRLYRKEYVISAIAVSAHDSKISRGALIRMDAPFTFSWGASKNHFDIIPAFKNWITFICHNLFHKFGFNRLIVGIFSRIQVKYKYRKLISQWRSGIQYSFVNIWAPVIQIYISLLWILLSYFYGLQRFTEGMAMYMNSVI